MQEATGSVMGRTRPHARTHARTHASDQGISLCTHAKAPCQHATRVHPHPASKPESRMPMVTRLPVTFGRWVRTAPSCVQSSPAFSWGGYEAGFPLAAVRGAVRCDCVRCTMPQAATSSRRTACQEAHLIDACKHWLRREPCRARGCADCVRPHSRIVGARLLTPSSRAPGGLDGADRMRGRGLLIWKQESVCQPGWAAPPATRRPADIPR